MENISLQALVLDLFLLNGPHEVVGEELPSDIYSLFD